MKTILLILGLSLLFSCNVVRWKEKSATNQLERKEIRAAYFDEDSLHIKYWKGGTGPALVFIHGFGGNALLSWEKELKQFSKTHTVIAMDILWFGESRSDQPATLATQTEAVEKLLKYLQVKKAIVVGQSYGGFVAIDFALKNTQMVEKLVVANCPGTTFDVKELDQVCQNYGVKRIEEFFVINDPQYVQRLINLSTYKDPKLPRFALKQSFEQYFNQNHKQLTSLMTTLPAEQKRMINNKPLQSIPTLVLWGEEDEIFSLAEGKKFATTINARFESIPKCGHAPQFDNHKAFLEILKSFIVFQ